MKGIKNFGRSLAVSLLGIAQVLIDPDLGRLRLTTAARTRRVDLRALCRDPLFIGKLDFFHGDVAGDERVKAWHATVKAWDREGWTEKYAPELPRGPYTPGDLLELGYRLNQEEMDAGRQFNYTRPEQGGRRAYR